MRIIVMFDIPTLSSADRKIYREFRKYLIKSGFMMMQESIYTKLVLNQTNADLVIKSLYKNKPPSGLVQALVVTEKQFARMEFIVGDINSEVIDTTDRVVIL